MRRSAGIDEGIALLAALPAGAQIAVRIHYKKTWQFEGKPLTDRSTLGVYFSKDSNAQELLTFALSSPGAPAKDAKDVTFSRTLTDDVQAVAVSPDEGPALPRCGRCRPIPARRPGAAGSA